MAANVEKLCTWPSTRRVLLQPVRAAARPRSRAQVRVDRRSMARVLPEKWFPCECCRPSVVHDDRRIGTICTTCSAGVARSCGSNALSPSALARPVALAFLKSYRRGSSRCEGTMFCSALKMFFPPPGGFFFPFGQHLADLLALQVLLAAAQVASDDGEVALGRPAGRVFFGHVGQRADHHMLAVVGD